MHMNLSCLPALSPALPHVAFFPGCSCSLGGRCTVVTSSAPLLGVTMIDGRSKWPRLVSLGGKGTQQHSHRHRQWSEDPDQGGVSKVGL